MADLFVADWLEDTELTHQRLPRHQEKGNRDENIHAHRTLIEALCIVAVKAPMPPPPPPKPTASGKAPPPPPPPPAGILKLAAQKVAAPGRGNVEADGSSAEDITEELGGASDSKPPQTEHAARVAAKFRVLHWTKVGETPASMIPMMKDLYLLCVTAGERVFTFDR